MSENKYQISKSRFHEIKKQISQKSILVVGDIGLDRYTMGKATRLSPEAPVPILMVEKQTDKLGMAANVAHNVKEFGARPILASVVGEDRVYEELHSLLVKEKISDQLLVRHKSRRTSLKERVVALPQHIVRIDHEITSPLSSDAEDQFLKLILPKIKEFDAIIVEDYAKGILTDKVARSIIETANQEKVFVSVDPTTVVRSLDIYKNVSLFKPNQVEAEKLTGIEIQDENSLARAGALLLERLDAPVVIITQGKEGMTIFEKKQKAIKIPTFARSVYDVSGAGDTVVSMLTLALVCGATLTEAALLANYSAGIEVGKQGTATVSMDELESYMIQLGALS
ncbi:MAG: D-glycero-beta-D-manno-heptose-7-phosphate kinase [Oligoflexia bacterium]|nr:D-glycero-beta-D-manno-heptose-7-phosphate kinase [Oligoflexia bacterium]